MFISIGLLSKEKLACNIPSVMFFSLNNLPSRLANAEDYCGELFNRVSLNPEENEVLMKNLEQAFD